MCSPTLASLDVEVYAVVFGCIFDFRLQCLDNSESLTDSFGCFLSGQIELQSDVKQIVHCIAF